MAMARSLAHLFFFLLVVSTAPAARDLPEPTTNLDEACDETRFPDLCARSLAPFPDSRTANPRLLAELSVLAALEAGRAAAEFVALTGVSEDDDALTSCLDSCSADIEEAVAHLSALAQEPTDARFLELKSWLSATLGGAATHDNLVCKDAPESDVRDAAVARSVEFDMTLRVALDLITEASGSMSVDALPSAKRGAKPPSYGAPRWSPAYGAGGAPYRAPSYGAPSYSGGNRKKPRAPAPAPFKGYGHRRPRAPAPSPSGDYGAGMVPRAPAPSPFSRGYGHRRPRHAPAPSPFGGYGAVMPRAPAPSPSKGYGHRRPRHAPPPPSHRRRPRAPAPSPSAGAPAPAPFGGYGSARRPRVPAPSPFVAYRPPVGAPAYGARRPRHAPAPSKGAPRPPAPPTYYSILETEETP